MQNIKHILSEIEAKKKIKILYACETGSRAWGFPSPDGVTKSRTYFGV